MGRTVFISCCCNWANRQTADCCLCAELGSQASLLGEVSFPSQIKSPFKTTLCCSANEGRNALPRQSVSTVKKKNDTLHNSLHLYKPLLRGVVYKVVYVSWTRNSQHRLCCQSNLIIIFACRQETPLSFLKNKSTRIPGSTLCLTDLIRVNCGV